MISQGKLPKNPIKLAIAAEFFYERGIENLNGGYFRIPFTAKYTG